jgi:hypothetical protein
MQEKKSEGTLESQDWLMRGVEEEKVGGGRNRKGGKCELSFGPVMFTLSPGYPQSGQQTSRRMVLGFSREKG